MATTWLEDKGDEKGARLDYITLYNKVLDRKEISVSGNNMTEGCVGHAEGANQFGESQPSLTSKS